jgi:hypothetical protein
MYLPGVSVQLTAYYNGYWIARAYIRLPFDLTTTPTTLIVLPVTNTATGVVVPIWAFECLDGDQGVSIHNPQMTFTTTTPPSGWDSNPYFDDRSWAASWGGAGRDMDRNMLAFQGAVYGTSAFYAVRYIVNLPLRPSQAVLYVKVGYGDPNYLGGDTLTFNGCPGSNCLAKVNGNPVGQSVSFSLTGPNRATYSFDVSSLVQAGPNLITTTATLSRASAGYMYLPGVSVQLTAYYNGYWIARAYIRLPFDLTTTPTTLIVLPVANANVRNPSAFMFFDDFDTWNPQLYTVSGLSVSASGGRLTITTTSSGYIQLAQSFTTPFAFIAKIDSNVQQPSSGTFVYFGWPNADTNFRITIAAGAVAPTGYRSAGCTGDLIYGAAWPWIAGFATMATTTLVVGQRYSTTFTSVSPLSTASCSNVANPSTAVNPRIRIDGASGYTVGITVDWLAVFRPPPDLRNPVYTAEVKSVTVTSTRVVLPGQPSATVLAYTFNATIFGGDVYNSGLLGVQGLLLNATNPSTVESYMVVSFPARSAFAVQFRYDGPFEVNLAYVNTTTGYISFVETLTYDGSAIKLVYGATPVLQLTPPASSGYVQLEVYGSERRVYVHTGQGMTSTRGSTTLASVNAVVYRGSASNFLVMEGLLATFTQNGLLAVSIKGVDVAGRAVDIFAGDARSPTSADIDLDAAPETITVGVPLGVYPVKATVTAYLDVQNIQYSLIVPQIPVHTVTLTPGAPATAPGGSLIAVLTRPLTALEGLVPAEHRQRAGPSTSSRATLGARRQQA